MEVARRIGSKGAAGRVNEQSHRKNSPEGKMKRALLTRKFEIGMIVVVIQGES